MKVSEFYGKQTESADKKTTGWVRAVLGKEGAPQFLQCFDTDEREFEIDLGDIIGVGEKIIYRDRSAERAQSTPIRLGLPAYSAAGKFLGHLTDIEFADQKIKAYIIGKKRYLPEDTTVGDVIIVRAPRRIKEDVTGDDGAIILRKNTAATQSALEKAMNAGEYIQAKLKSL